MSSEKNNNDDNSECQQDPSSSTTTKLDETCRYMNSPLTIFVVGASGDLAKKKTYPSLFDLYRHGFLPRDGKTTICGYARSEMTDLEFRARIEPFLQDKDGATEGLVKKFLDMCLYRHGDYDNAHDVGKAFADLKRREDDAAASLEGGGAVPNRLFYFAIPPSVFVPIGTSLKSAVIGPSEAPGFPVGVGWNRLIIEKPFGKDSESFEQLSSDMSALYSENHIYRIDHYLGKGTYECVRNRNAHRAKHSTCGVLYI